MSLLRRSTYVDVESSKNGFQLFWAGFLHLSWQECLMRSPGNILSSLRLQHLDKSRRKRAKCTVLRRGSTTLDYGYLFGEARLFR